MSVPKQGLEVCVIDDIRIVEDILEESEVTEMNFTDKLVMDMRHLEVFEGCCSCSIKAMPQCDTSAGKCTRCATVQCIDQCKS